MRLPPPSPPLRGFLLKLLSKLTSINLFRSLLLLKVRADAGIPRLPDVPKLPASASSAAALPARAP
jgi:hypothetical protein